MQFWTSQAVAAGLPLTDLILQQKALELAKMLDIEEDKIQFSNGWIWRFKWQNGLRKIKYSGEANSVPIESLLEERARLRTILANNADETELFFRMEPN